MSRPCENCGADLRTCKDCDLHDGYIKKSVIEKIKAEIEKKIKICENASLTCSKRESWVQFTHDKTTYQKVLSIIDQAIKECDTDDSNKEKS